ncbi:MAG: 4-hydroxy-tetrahydrodipicolinate reductase [Saprospiraceae bacterium]|nr:4-hydroxy-tetrahydrodipicolinate reductase [Saprospiraceae bacterium]MDW8484428.1 4-hydroxy-tetrahydrodipicolinate reductase [Saprospiraceae bacterium]
MRIGLLGYGKMGRAVEERALLRNHEIVWRIGWSNRAELTPERLQEADVVIEFSRPEAAFDNVIACLSAGVAVVSGTTGWTDQLPQAEQFCRERGGALLWSSNFSIGVNLFFVLSQYLACLMANRDEYSPSIEETHHVHKIDAPSGTAQTLAEGIVRNVPRIQRWQLAIGQPMPPDTLSVTAIRRGEISGIHVVRWDSSIDTIEIRHIAHSRAGFAVGALLAAEWLIGKKGVFNMRDVLNLNVL